MQVGITHSLSHVVLTFILRKNLCFLLLYCIKMPIFLEIAG